MPFADSNHSTPLGALESFPDFPDPPFSWDAVPRSYPNDQVDLQWEHYRPLFKQCGYILRTVLCIIHTDDPTLPPPEDPFTPELDKLYVPCPLGPQMSSGCFTQKSVRSGCDTSSRGVFFKALFGAELDVMLYLAQQQSKGRDPRDHTVPILKIIQTPRCTFAITPQWGNIGIPFYALGEAVDFMKQCLEGLAYLHEHRIVHRDLSTSNIVMSYGGDFAYHPDGVKPFRSLFTARYAFIDFGLSRRFGRRVAHDDVTIVCASGTVPFVPPEVFVRKPYNPFRADIYSLGSIMFERLEYDEICYSRVPKLLEEHLPAFLDLIKRMTDEVPSHRPSATEAYEEVLRMQSSVDPSILLLAEQPELKYFDHEAWRVARMGITKFDDSECGALALELPPVVGVDGPGVRLYPVNARREGTSLPSDAQDPLPKEVGGITRFRQCLCQ